MAQHDHVLDNAAGAAFRADLNNALLAIVSQNSGATAPPTTYAYQWWADTTTGLLKIRNAANSAWVTVGTLASTNLGLLALSGGTLTGLLTFFKGANIASATTVDLTAATGNLVHITGTTLTTGLTMNSGQVVWLIADAAWPLTYHATNLKLNSGGVDKTLAAGDMVMCYYDGTTKYAFIIKADGTAVVVSTAFALQAWASKTIDTVYQASTDGFVVATYQVAGTLGGLLGYTDSSNPPTTQRAANTQYDATYNLNGAITFPVRSGDYWKVTTSGTLNTSQISWVPATA